MDEARVNAMLQAVQTQRDKALNEVVFLTAELASLKQENEALKKEAEPDPDKE